MPSSASKKITSGGWRARRFAPTRVSGSADARGGWRALFTPLMGRVDRAVGAAPLQASDFLFFNDTATTEIYTLSLHDALPIWIRDSARRLARALAPQFAVMRN